MENLNKYINKQNKALLESSFTMEGLFNIIHDQDERVFAEYIDNYEIKKIKYKDFRRYALKFAKYVSLNVKSEKGEFVGIYLENCLNFVAAFWGLLASGYKVALLNVRLPKEINEHIIDMLDIKDVISYKEEFSINEIVINNSNNYLDEVINLEELNNPTWENEIALSTTATSKNYKVCIYKGSDLTYQALNAKSIIKKNSMIKRHYNESLKLLTFLPFYHIFGLVATYFWFSLFGRTFVFLNDYSSETILKTIQRHKVTHVFSVPLLWNTLVREIKKEIKLLNDKDKKKLEKGYKISRFIQNIAPEAGLKLARCMFSKITQATLGDSIKFLISGGGYISDETLEIINSIGYPLYNGYGSTEIGITSVELRKKYKYRVKGTVGVPFDSVSYKVIDDTLYVKGKSTCSIIINKDKTKSVINKDEYFNTCDNVKVDKDGYYYILGRCDDVYLNENGEKINPDIIEKKCLLTTVSNYAIIDLDSKLSFVFEVNRYLSSLKIKNIYNEVSSTINNLNKEGYMINKVYFTYDRLVNPNAIKVSRKILKDDINSGKIKLIDFSELKKYQELSSEEVNNEIYNKVKEIFALVLEKDVKDISNDAHFIFDLGGSSLDYFSLLIKMKNEFNMEFNFGSESYSTVKEFGNYIIDKMRDQ